MSRFPDNGNTSGTVSQLTENLFRYESSKIISILTGFFGIDRLHVAEEIAQEALVRALQTWPWHGIPDNPAAWLTQTAKNLALDLLRREKLFRDKQPDITASVEQWATDSVSTESPLFENEIKAGPLRLMFACCHPLIPQESQTALALKTLCGFSAAEISRAFLTTESAITKRLTRARQRIRDLSISIEIPSGWELSLRLDGVLQTLYLLFNEGYKASSGESPVRGDLCSEAIRLTTMLSEHAIGNQPRTHALLALMLLNGARLPARVNTEGKVLRLSEQDRTLWNRAMINCGILHLGQSAAGDKLSAYHLQAGISACHCTAVDYQSTDWRRILSMYDSLIELDDSPIVALNRAVALACVEGPGAGIQAIEAIRNRQPLTSYYLLYVVLAEFERQLDEYQSAADHLRQALQLTGVTSEQAVLSKRLQECEELM